MNKHIGNIWRKYSAVSVIAIALAAFVLGLILSGGDPQPPAAQDHGDPDGGQVQAEVWTCSMHPNIRQPGPGQCPICGMDLIPVTSDNADENIGPREIKLSAAARTLAEIQTAPAQRKDVSVTIRLAGKVKTDETRESKITAWVPGRLERLYVDYTGETVRKGDPLVEVYSPDLLTAQQELLAALRAQQEMHANRSTSVIKIAERTVEAAREKLRLWGLTAGQIEEIERRGTPSERITVTAPMGGTVTHKDAVEGMYVKIGTPIYTVSDLSYLWVLLDAYESDLAWIKEGQRVEFTTRSYPGETFSGTIVFVDPLVNTATRTVKVRVELPNPDGKLKPEMFVHAAVQADAAGTGRAQMPLVIPASAPLITGTRAVVYVELPGDEGRYEGREIVLGPRAGDYYVVRDGLAEGEKVVVNGAFKIDSEIQIMAKPSMMSPEAGAPPMHHHDQENPPSMPEMETTTSGNEPLAIPENSGQQIGGIFAAYFAVHDALSHDKFDEARNAAGEIVKALDSVNMESLPAPAHQTWMAELNPARESARGIVSASDIADARVKFEPLSDAMYAIAKNLGTGSEDSIFLIHCPMAFNNRGADWLQTSTGVENPYFGSKMFKCGVVKDTLLAGQVK
jgi:Cu(I)/Ag(I) efflux system membrane fusion protein